MPEFDLVDTDHSANALPVDETEDEPDFELWRVIKTRALEKIERLHTVIRYGEFLGSKVKLPTGEGKPMELDFIGTHEDGLFILELKVDRSAERNAFSELFAYSNYIAGIFALSGHKDITNVLVANLDVKITRQAFLYDLLISDRDVIVYKPVLGNSLASLRLQLYIPSDEDFRQFTNDLLSHDTMACVVISFDDLPGWIDNQEEDGSLNSWTRKNLANLSTYAAQLMEAERLHGFCFVRKPFQEIPWSYRSSLIICALNPFKIAQPDRTAAFLEGLDEVHHQAFFEAPLYAFDGRLIRLAQRAVRDCLTHGHTGEVETPEWASMITSIVEVVACHKHAFRPTGMLREAYVSFLDEIYARNLTAEYGEDVEYLKASEIYNWSRAWTFMEMCGFDRALDESALSDDDE